MRIAPVQTKAVTSITGRAGYPIFARTASDIDARIRYLLPVVATSNRKEVQP